MAGVNDITGKPIDGFGEVQQALGKIFSTEQGARPMREWFGNPGLRLLGENQTAATVLLWFTILYMLSELFEPRFKITAFAVEDMSRIGFTDFTMIGKYRPYAHLNFVQASAYVSVNGSTVTLSDAS